MARRRGNNIAAAYIPVASNAGDLAAMANAYSAFGENVSGIGSGIKTGVAEWAGHETDRAVQYLDSLGDDQARNAALAQMQQDPIGAFLDVGAATKAVDAMQMRDMKVEERAEQAIKAKDVHLDAARALTQDTKMDPERFNQLVEEISGKKATRSKTEADTGKIQKETIGIESTIALRKAQAEHEESQTSKLNIETKKAQQEYDIEEKSIKDTKDIGLQLDELSKMSLIAEGPNPEFGTKTIQKEQERLELNYLSAVTKQVQDNKRAGRFDKHGRLKEILSKSLARYNPGITEEQFVTAGVNENFTPDSHEALRRILVDALATRYPTNTDAELRKQANKIIDTHPGDLRTKFAWGDEFAKQKYPERLARHHKKVMNKQINEIQSAKKLEDKIKLIGKHKGMNIRTVMSPGEMERFNQFTRPIIEKFVGGINARDLVFDNLPDSTKSDVEFQKRLVFNQDRLGLPGAIEAMDPRLFTSTLQRKMYRGLRKRITDQMGPMLKSELQPLVEMIMGEHPAITKQFATGTRLTKHIKEKDELRMKHEKDLMEIDHKSVIRFKDNSTLVESIIDNIEKQAESDKGRGDINSKQLKYSIENAAATIKRTLGVNSKWSQPNQDALNIAIGSFLSGVRVNYNVLLGNDYVLPHISLGRDVSKLNPNQLIDGLKDHLEFAASNVKGADEFNSVVGKYAKDNPYKESYMQKMLEKWTVMGRLIPELYHGQNIYGDSDASGPPPKFPE